MGNYLSKTNDDECSKCETLKRGDRCYHCNPPNDGEVIICSGCNSNPITLCIYCNKDMGICQRCNSYGEYCSFCY